MEVYEQALAQGQLSGPLEYHRIRIALGLLYRDGNSYNAEQMAKDHPEIFARAKAVQSTMILTPEDYVAISKEVVFSLVVRKYFNNGKWDRAALDRDSANRKQIAKLLEDAYISAKLPYMYEVKVPTLIERRHFINKP